MKLRSLVATVATLSAASTANAGGLYFADRGVRPLGRAGAFVAGADDLGAIAYNPAGIYDAGGQFLLDASYLHFSSDYTRQAILDQVDPNTGKTTGHFQQTFPSVSGTAPFLPIPTIAFSFQPHKQWVVAIGAWAPNAAAATYPDTGSDGKPAPQRYSLITLKGSALAILDLTAAFAPSKELRFGASLQALVGNFDFQGDLTACLPERFLCAPEEPSWDVLSQVNTGPIFTPSGNLGAIWIPDPRVRFGAAFQLPFYIRAPAKIETRLPAAPIFEQASQDGTSASVAFDVPWTLRLGVEGRPTSDLRVEAGFEFDRWSMLDKISITPNDVALVNVASFPQRYNLPPVSLEKNFKDVESVRVGGEYAFKLGGFGWDARGGVSFETSAIPKGYETVQTLDLAKVTLAVGASFHASEAVRIDLTYAHVFGISESLDPADAKITQVYPLAANPPKSPDYINGGDYAARADVVGLGLAYTFGKPPSDFVTAAAK